MAQILITVGGLFLIGLIADLVGRHTPLPRVTILLVAGFAVGPAVLDWLPPFTREWFPVLTSIALAMVGFLLGQRMTPGELRANGRAVLGVSISVVLVTAAVVTSGLMLVGVPFSLALILGGIATSTAPAATADVVREMDDSSDFAKTLLGIVALDDAWGLLLFTLILAIAQGTAIDAAPAATIVTGLRDIGAALIIGLVLGLPLAYLTGRIRPGEPTQAEALGSVLLTAGIATWFEVSAILSAMTLGFCVATFARHHSRPFHAIEGIEWPFLILFFILAGASLDISALNHAGWIGLGYILLRIIGRILGARLGGAAGGLAPDAARWMGIALLPQAGVAIGLALLASQRLPELASSILPVVLGATVFFELLGPVAARAAIRRMND